MPYDFFPVEPELVGANDGSYNFLDALGQVRQQQPQGGLLSAGMKAYQLANPSSSMAGLNASAPMGSNLLNMGATKLGGLFSSPAAGAAGAGSAAGSAAGAATSAAPAAAAAGGGGIMSTLASGGQGLLSLIAGLFSDEELKKNKKGDNLKEVSDFLDQLQSYEYEYKNKDHGEGKKYGVMAQDLEKSKVGKALVKETQEGKMIDIGQGVGTTLAALSYIHNRLKKLEGEDGKRK